MSILAGFIMFALGVVVGLRWADKLLVEAQEKLKTSQENIKIARYIVNTQQMQTTSTDEDITIC